MGRSTKEARLSEQRKYRSWTAKQKLEIVLAGLRGDVSVKELCRRHEIAETQTIAMKHRTRQVGPSGALRAPERKRALHALRLGQRREKGVRGGDDLRCGAR